MNNPSNATASKLHTALEGYRPNTAQLCAMLRGVEREGLRVLPRPSTTQLAGSLAQTPHPAALGSALTHPSITTDFSESQLELITTTHSSAEDCEAELHCIHRVTHQALAAQSEPELLWANSMACILPDENSIPIGQYGSSYTGQAKSVYRMGLSNRYGRRMQTISGLHYNWSMPGLGTDEYLALIRNFRRESWLLLYLFGASPVVEESFVAGKDHPLESMAPGTMGLPYATSLRMGRLGYQSDAQASISASFNCLESYAASLERALTESYPPYEAIGVQDASGQYQQLASTLLQIENEFYSTIRPKRVVQSGERPLHALRERGVQYIEVRCMDLNPFTPLGIDAEAMRFLDLFLLHCLRHPSPPDNPAEQTIMSENQVLVAHSGRKPDLHLKALGGGDVALSDWAKDILEDCAQIAQELDGTLCKPGRVRDTSRSYGAACESMQKRIQDPSLLPSSRLLALLESKKTSYIDLSLEQSRQHAAYLGALPLSPTEQAHFASLAKASLEQQAQLEAQPQSGAFAAFENFEAFRQHYVSSSRLK